MIQRVAARLAGRPGLEWALLSAWVALVGVQIPVGIPNFRFSPADAVLAALMAVLVIRRRSDLLNAARRFTPVHVFAGALLIALIWGSAVSLARTGTLAREAALNKDLGFFVLASILLAVLTVVRDRDDVRLLLRNFLVTGTIVAWIGTVATLLVPLALGLPFGQRLDGLLLNPSANAVFLSVLLMAQIGSSLGPRIVPWSQRLQVTNTLGLTFLLLLTLSRSTWLAVIVALVALIVLVARRRPLLPAVIALVLLVFAGQPLAAALFPVVSQVMAGQLGRFERETAPSSTPQTDLGHLLPSPSATVPVTAAPTTAPPTSTPPPTPGPTSAPPTIAPSLATPPPTTAPVARYLSDAHLTAIDRFGATDRLAFDIVAVKVWLGGPLTAATGIGLDVFLLISPLLFGTSAIIHSTYVWLPVEMGVPGIAALLALVYAISWVVRRMRDGSADRPVAVAIVGSLMVFVVWFAENEGLYQRSLWLMLALACASIAATGPRKRTST